jgi:hypothetical protein
MSHVSTSEILRGSMINDALMTQFLSLESRLPTMAVNAAGGLSKISDLQCVNIRYVSQLLDQYGGF